MGKEIVSIPGDILRNTLVLGLTYDEILLLGSLPLVIVLPSLLINEIPLIVSGVIVVLSAIGVVLLILQAPEGQTPLEWAPARLKLKLSDNKYNLRQHHRHRDQTPYLSRVQTHDELVHEYDECDDFYINGNTGEIIASPERTDDEKTPIPTVEDYGESEPDSTETTNS